jgi:hypothetical protein
MTGDVPHEVWDEDIVTDGDPKPIHENNRR